MAQADVRSIYRSLKVFRDLNAAELDELIAISREIVLEPDVELFQENDLSDAMYVVLSGLVQIRMRLHRGEEYTLATLEPGEMFGELSLVDRFPRSAAARTIETTRLCCLDAAGLDRLREALRPSAYKVLNALGPVLCARLRAVNVQLEDFMSAPGSCGATPEQRDIGLAMAPAAIGAVDRPVHEQLSDLTLFRCFEADDLRRLGGLCKTHVLAEDEILCEKGEPNADLYIIVQGGLDVWAELPGGELSRLQRLGADNIVGQVAWIDGGPRSATLTAWRKSLVLEVDRERYRHEFAAGSPFAYKFLDLILGELALRLREADRQLFDFFKRAEA